VPYEVFVDSGAWVAIARPADPYHRVATQYYQQALRQAATFVTTNLVIAETHVTIARRVGFAQGLQFVRTTRSTPRLTKIYSTPELERQAEEILIRYADQDFSFTDAVSFAVMRERGIREAFAFDQHFMTAGFTVVPPRNT
jgi:hypothetical protein